MRLIFVLLSAVALSACTTTDIQPVAADARPNDLANSYDLEVDVTPASKHIAVRGTIELMVDEPTTQAAFMLNDGLEIETFRPDIPATMQRERGIAVGTYEMPNTQRITLEFANPLTTGQRVTIDVAYSGYIRDGSIEWGRGIISEDWTELSLGTLWYPFWRDESLMRSRIAVRVPDGYQVLGPGNVERDHDGRWIVAPEQPILGRITFATSPNYTVTSRTLAPGFEARLHTLGNEPRAADILSGAEDVYRYYSNLMGPPRVRSPELTMILGNEDIGIAQPPMSFATGGNYVALGIAPPRGQDFTLAHELAHFWWILGAAGTPDEFLTESLAEYVALRYGQSAWGDEWLAAKLERATRISQSIDGSILDEGDFDGRETLLYFRGPLILWDLQRRIGTEAMDDLLASTHARDINKLRSFIELIDNLEGAETSRWFEDRL